jgi:ring-1,2-phenylacetyl-CoA epoxidase subunit PaaB
VTTSNHGGPTAAVFTNMTDSRDPNAGNGAATDSQWPLWEVFVQPPKGEAHEHAGSLHAVSAEMALQNARDVYARRGEAVSIWVVPSESITASTPEDMGPFFDPGNDKPYRHPQFYKVPRGVRV